MRRSGRSRWPSLAAGVTAALAICAAGNLTAWGFTPVSRSEPWVAGPPALHSSAAGLPPLRNPTTRHGHTASPIDTEPSVDEPKPTPTRTPSPSVSRTRTPPPTPATPPTTPKPTPPTTPKPAGTLPAGDDSAAEVLRLVNVERSKAGCRPVVADPVLATVARAHSQDMAVRGYFAHNELSGRSPFDRMTTAGYRFRAAAENIAAGQATPSSVMTSWMNSPGHRANILNCSLADLGVGMYRLPGSPYGIYWTQDFGTRG